MGYVGGRVEPWFSQVPVRWALHSLTDEAGEQMVKNVRELTPKDTGHLWRSIHKIPVTHRGLRWRSGAETSVEYAEYVERGTGVFGPYHRPYVIRPKNPDGWLRWIDPVTGNPVFRKQVLHPGSEGAYMFSKGAERTEKEFGIWAEPTLRVWALMQERVNFYTGIR